MDNPCGRALWAPGARERGVRFHEIALHLEWYARAVSGEAEVEAAPAVLARLRNLMSAVGARARARATGPTRPYRPAANGVAAPSSMRFDRPGSSRISWIDGTRTIQAGNR
jgi:hypothetical protein